jgi:hypothetical protein
MHHNRYLENPILTKGYYYVKCTGVEKVDRFGTSATVIELQVVPYQRHEDAANEVLYVTLRDTPSAAPLLRKFLNTFHVLDDPALAVGHIGCVIVDVDEFRGKQYGAVHFVQQSDIALHEAYLLESQDRHGGLKWADPNMPVR